MWLASAARLVRRTFTTGRILRIGTALAATEAAFIVLVWIGLAGYYNLRYAESLLPFLLAGLRGTALFVVVAIPLGFSLGLLMGWARVSRSWYMRAIGSVYVEFFRGIAPLALIVFSSIIISALVQRVFYVEDPAAYAIAAGLIALSLHSSAYQAEILRAGILSVPTGQVEAAEAIGLTRGRAMVRVTLPQAFRVSLPALGNEFASVIKDTSLLSVISALELSYAGGVRVPSALQLDFNLVFLIWIEVALLYLVLTFAVTRTVRLVENVSKVPGLEAAEL